MLQHCVRFAIFLLCLCFLGRLDLTRWISAVFVSFLSDDLVCPVHECLNHRSFML